MILDCPNIYQCLRVHGDGPDDLQLYLIRQDLGDQSLAVWLVFCTAGSPVSSPRRIRRERGYRGLMIFDSALFIQTGGAVSAAGNNKTRAEILRGE